MILWVVSFNKTALKIVDFLFDNPIGVENSNNDKVHGWMKFAKDGSYSGFVKVIDDNEFKVDAKVSAVDVVESIIVGLTAFEFVWANVYNILLLLVDTANVIIS